MTATSESDAAMMVPATMQSATLVRVPLEPATCRVPSQWHIACSDDSGETNTKLD